MKRRSIFHVQRRKRIRRRRNFHPLRPLLDPLRRALHPFGHARNYNVGQTTLF
ncbi:MAG: hypothetical protein JO266_11495 [Acidobacteria bacterium]|nr:hypothetical protein [Acidobacteriota bacterium]